MDDCVQNGLASLLRDCCADRRLRRRQCLRQVVEAEDVDKEERAGDGLLALAPLGRRLVAMHLLGQHRRQKSQQVAGVGKRLGGQRRRGEAGTRRV